MKTNDKTAAEFLLAMIKSKRHKNWLAQKIQEFQKKHPGTIESLVKASRKISELENTAKTAKPAKKIRKSRAHA